MISRISIQNFQSHRDTVMTLDKGVNCIIGSSDVGKTAIIRALRWLVWNRPSGDAFRSTWGGDTKVSVEFDGLVGVERAKGKHNTYYLDNMKFSAVKTDVPEEIARVINMNEINLQQQFDRPFLLDESPGTVAAFFNTIAHLDIIDQAIHNIQSWIRDIGARITVNENTIEDKKEALKEFEGLDDLDEQVAELEALSTKRNKLASNAKKLEQVLTHIVITDKAIGQYDDIVKHEEGVHALTELISKRDATIKRKEKLTSHLTQLSQTKNNLKIIESEQAKRQEEFDQEFPSVCPLCGKPK